MQVDKYVQSHIQINEYRDRFLLVRHWSPDLPILHFVSFQATCFLIPHLIVISDKLFLCFEQPQISKVKGRHVGSCLKILDMTGLRLSAFSRLKTSTAIATVDDLNYPEKTDTYYIVNAPYVFSACWKVCSQTPCRCQLHIRVGL